MRILLDTHAFLWWITDSKQLSTTAREIIANSSNEILFSAVSGWEIGIKVSLKKIKLTAKPESFIISQINKNGFQLLSLSAQQALRAASLPNHHKDPFDRMLICQAQAENIPILSVDPYFRRYDVKVVW